MSEVVMVQEVFDADTRRNEHRPGNDVARSGMGISERKRTSPDIVQRFNFTAASRDNNGMLKGLALAQGLHKNPDSVSLVCLDICRGRHKAELGYTLSDIAHRALEVYRDPQFDLFLQPFTEVFSKRTEFLIHDSRRFERY